jgi:hypothetical protein
MKKLLFTISSLFFTLTAMAVQRFPKPEFESGYKYPDLHYALPHEMVWEVVDIVLLVVLMSVVAWAMMKKRNRKPIVWVSIISIAYFGFFRKGCVCSIGSIQNVVLAFVDPTYVLPLSVLAFFHPSHHLRLLLRKSVLCRRLSVRSLAGYREREELPSFESGLYSPWNHPLDLSGVRHSLCRYEEPFHHLPF